MNSVIKVQSLEKNYKGFKLDIPSLEIPKGYATALIGENGAGKSTFLNIISGIRYDYEGEITFFENYSAEQARELDCSVRDDIGYCGPGNYYLPTWSFSQIKKASKLLFDNFDVNRFNDLCINLGIVPDARSCDGKKITEFSEGNKMKIMLAGVLARDTKMLILDEPASPLDPLMRDRLCELIHEYMEDGEKTVLFSTHNISDMENVTDYAIIMEHGQIMETGFVEELKEKYVMVKGNAEDAETAKNTLVSISRNKYGFEGLCLAEKVDALAGMDISLERPTLSQISVGIMKQHTILGK